MAERIKRGEIWLFDFSHPDKRRPVLVLTRPEVIELLHTVMIGVDEGLKKDSAIDLDHVQTVEKAR